MAEEQNCHNCFFSRIDVVTGHRTMACHIEPPKLLDTTSVQWPLVSLNDWCGQWKKKEEEDI